MTLETKEIKIIRMKKFILVFLLPFSLSCSEQESPNNEIVPPEGIKIGDQIWTKENLNVSFFQNGDPIPEAKTSAEWLEAYRDFRPAWSYYKNLQINGDKYGKLYNWYAVSDPRGLAPKGWRVPFKEDWEKLSKNLGGAGIAGKKLKSKTGWEFNGNGNDLVGFNALPGNYRYFRGDFEPVNNNGQFAVWWTKTPSFSNHSWFVQIHSSLDEFVISSTPQGNGKSIRLIKE